MFENIDISKVPAFLAVAECLNFTVAADRLYVSQSSLSKTIAALEDAVGFPLFVRRNRKVVLTTEGAYLYKELSKIMSAFNRTMENATSINRGLSGGFTVGTSGYLSRTPIFERLCSEFSVNNPTYDIEFKHLEYSDVRGNLLNGKLDLILTNQNNLDMLRSYQMLRVFKSEPVLLCNAHIYHDYPNSRQPLRDFKDKNYVCVDRLPGCYSYLMSTCEAYGFKPNITHYTSSLIEAVNYVCNTACVTILDRSMFPMDTTDIRAIPIPHRENMPKVDTIFVWDKNNPNRALQSFIRFAEELLGTKASKISPDG